MIGIKKQLNIDIENRYNQLCDGMDETSEPKTEALHLQDVVCWASNIEGLTEQNEYKVLLELNEMYVVKDDNGHPTCVGVDHFSPCT